MRGAGHGWVRRTSSAVVGLALAATGVTALATSAQAVEVVPRPASGTLSVNGHGFGHGRGMSQWGAYGAATEGLSYAQILAFYYPGTALSTLPSSRITVRVTGDTDGWTEVLPQSGLVATSGSASWVLPSSDVLDRWRVTTSPLTLQYHSSSRGVWYTYPLPAGTSSTFLRFTRPAGTVRLLLNGIFREYEGYVANGYYSGARYSVVGTSMETYLRGVVPNEMPASWATEALKAQAVAARTYAANQRATSPSSRPYQTCDSTACQVFDGVADYSTSGGLIARHTDPRSDAAVAATVSSSGVPYALTYHGALAFTEFSASNGGWTTAGTVPYLVAKADPYDGAVPNSAHSWTDSVSVSTLERAYPSIGHLTSLVVDRDGNGQWGGRVDSVTLVGTSGRTTVSGTSFASTAGFLHRWWNERYVPLVRDATSDGVPDVVGREGGTGDVYTWHGTTSGGIGAATHVGGGWNVMTEIEAAGDWDGDGRTDLLAVERATGYLWLYRGTGDGHFADRVKIGEGWASMRHLAVVGDLSGDGNPDLVAVGSTGLLALYRGDGVGGIRSSHVIGKGWGVYDALAGVGDVTGDSVPDLLARDASSGQLYYYSGNGRSGFVSGRTAGGHGWDVMQALASPGDLTGDGKPDLVAIERSTGTLWLYPWASPSTYGTRRALAQGWGVVTDLG